VRDRRTWSVTALLLAAVVVMNACSSDEGGGGSETGAVDATGSATGAAGDPSTDKLAQILARGTLVAYYEPDYPPQSIAVEGAKRAAETKCGPDQLTAGEITGFDPETTKLVAAELGVETCFVTPTWSEVTAGNWGDRWGIAYGSGSINEDRMERLWMTQPYYAVPNYYFVHEDSKFQTPSDLDGLKIGACASCSHELYLRGELVIPGIEIVQTVEAPQIVTFETEGPGLEAVANGEIDAFLAAGPVGQALIDEGLPLRALDEIAFTYYPSGFVDKSSGLDSRTFVERVNEIIRAAQADGALPALSEEWFGTDYITAAAAFDLDATGQVVTAP
jgi:ABC-type amino acid transport substrate-binding protein